ncbi:MAG: phosphoribosylamine--glycine ligase [Alphaproteobacteria bacterium]|nr:MAG: phosphoribosylamine--glycine ligase [Alphaproteobacteria bacterium]
MKVLVIGSGGREHALCWALSASSLVDALYAAPGNAGMAEEAQCVDIAADDIGTIGAFAKSNAIDLVVIGPEGPLVAGLADLLEADGIKAFGPSAAAARLEGSKGFTKDICARYGIPTAAYGRFTETGPALDYLQRVGAPIVVKADGLAAGKGVIMAETVAEAEAAVADILDGDRFGAAGSEVLIEEWLGGEEASFFALVDGVTALPLASAQDHKRAGEADTGPNTGGMGAYSPAPVVTEALAGRIMDRVIEPTVRAMNEAGCPYRGVLYAGVMIADGVPKLLEYNVRFGDPECQVLVLRLRSDLLPALLAAREGGLKHFDLRWRDEAALSVVMAAKGYPGAYGKGSEIRGIEAADAIDGVKVFHAGTKAEDGKLLAVGGRVLNVTALAPTIAEAQAKAYRAVDAIDWPGGFCRRDIGFRAVG